MFVLWEAVIFTLLLAAPGLKGFDYSHPEMWVLDDEKCSGTRQSPIDLDLDQVKREVISKKKLKWTNYDKMPSIMSVVNTGHTVKLVPKWSNEKDIPYLTDGPLDDKYTLQQIHFHWGPYSDVGSEHTIRGRAFALEAHMVHKNEDYDTMQDALKHKDGLAIIGSFYDVDNDEDGTGVMERVGKLAAEVSEKHEEKDVKPFPINRFDVVHTKKPIVAYKGSLTTPGCNEAVTWLLPYTTYPIDERVLENLRGVELENGDDRNYRPVQPLNGREVTVYH